MIKWLVKLVRASLWEQVLVNSSHTFMKLCFQGDVFVTDLANGNTLGCHGSAFAAALLFAKALSPEGLGV